MVGLWISSRVSCECGLKKEKNPVKGGMVRSKTSKHRPKKEYERADPPFIASYLLLCLAPALLKELLKLLIRKMRLNYLIGSYIDWLMFDLNRESGQMLDGTGCHRPVFVVFSLRLSPGIDAGNHLSPLFSISLAFHSHKRRDEESWEALLALI